MNYSKTPVSRANLYNQVGVQTSVGAASPHKLIQMLLDGALDKISTAKGALQRGEIALRGRQISQAISIIDGLRASLDMEKGGEVSANLFELYSYMERRLFEANLQKNMAMLDEVSSLLGQIKSSWDAIPQGDQQPQQNRGMPEQANHEAR
jgi:flagellar protein FliS